MQAVRPSAALALHLNDVQRLGTPFAQLPDGAAGHHRQHQDQRADARHPALARTGLQTRHSEAWPAHRQPSKIATARVQPADAPRILCGKQLMVKPCGGSASRLCSFSRWQ